MLIVKWLLRKISKDSPDTCNRKSVNSIQTKQLKPESIILGVYFPSFVMSTIDWMKD